MISSFFVSLRAGDRLPRFQTRFDRFPVRYLNRSRTIGAPRKTLDFKRDAYCGLGAIYRPFRGEPRVFDTVRFGRVVRTSGLQTLVYRPTTSENAIVMSRDCESVPAVRSIDVYPATFQSTRSTVPPHRRVSEHGYWFFYDQY